jgi:hypothetical protein
MTKQLFRVGLLIVLGSSFSGDLLACGDKFLMIMRGTRFQRARNPAAILVYVNPATAMGKALANQPVEETLRKVGYRPTAVSSAGELEKALRQGGWDAVLADLADSAEMRARLQGDRAPVVVPVAYNATGMQLAQAKKEYRHIIKAPVKSLAMFGTIDDALARRDKELAKLRKAG